MDSEVERRQYMMLAKNFIERGSAAKHCACHLTCKRENGDNKQRKKKGCKKNSEPQNQKILTAGKHKIANTRLVVGDVDITDTEE